MPAVDQTRPGDRRPIRGSERWPNRTGERRRDRTSEANTETHEVSY
ncbi:hypothetical protein RYH80_09305 [Halobaculum sp. MBLA0147]